MDFEQQLDILTELLSHNGLLYGAQVKHPTLYGGVIEATVALNGIPCPIQVGVCDESTPENVVRETFAQDVEWACRNFGCGTQNLLNVLADKYNLDTDTIRHLLVDYNNMNQTMEHFATMEIEY